MLLDVPEVRVDEISLAVEDLVARVSLEAGVLQLLNLHVGVDAVLGHVQLTIKGVEARAFLNVRLGNVTRILERALTTLDDNPEIVERLTESAGRAVEGVGTAEPAEDDQDEQAAAPRRGNQDAGERPHRGGSTPRVGRFRKTSRDRRREEG